MEAAALSNGAVVPDFSEDPDPDELLSDEDAPDLQDEIAKTLTSLRVSNTGRKFPPYSKIRNCCRKDSAPVFMNASDFHLLPS